MKSMEARRAELYEHLASRATATAVELGIEKALAEHVAAAVVDGFVEDVGGEVLSFPKDAAYKLSQRELEISLRRTKGASIAVLAKEYGMTERGLRKLLSRVERRDPSLNQPELFST